MSDKTAAWTEYLAAAHRLDSVRREAASAVAAEAEAVGAARSELPTVQARLAIQAGRLLESALQAGVAPPTLVPSPAEQHIAEHAVQGGPHVVLTALRQARSEVDVADAALSRLDEPEPGQIKRNLLVYGPAGAVATLIQVIFALLADPRTREFYAIACGLTMAALLFGVAWLLVSLVFPRRPKTPVIGAIACLAPVVFAAFLFIVF
ncbi:hypothetical protein [Allorhizocola rhizosphaerae]|uniref:hypothetical protein n=1 Tax=Allorhizocola rhizosphaerae TaxID=1872709 RepID=UPI000E3CEF46|nr:hypothetical protein [Allorhizocola rhizosphaerae]